MTNAGSRAAVVSTDRELRDDLRTLLEQVPMDDISVDVEIDQAYENIADAELQELRQVEPDLIFLDLETNPHVGLKFAEFLLDSEVTRALVGVGRDVDNEFLLSAMQAGVLEFLEKPLELDDVKGAVARVWRKTGRRKRSEETERTGRLLPIFSPKGGTGSTTIATNLAVELHRISRSKTLLVDLDLELGETSLLLGVEPKFSIVDLIKNFHRVDSGLLASYIERHESGVELLSAPYEPVGFETFDGKRIRQILEFLKEHYEYIVADVPKSFNPTAQAAFEASQEIVLVTTANLPSVRNISRSLPLLEQMNGGSMANWMSLAVNRYDSRQPIGLREIEDTLELEVDWRLRNDYQTVMEAVNKAQPAVTMGASKFSEDIRNMAADITGVTVEQETPSWLRRTLNTLMPGSGADIDLSLGVNRDG